MHETATGAERLSVAAATSINETATAVDFLFLATATSTAAVAVTYVIHVPPPADGHHTKHREGDLLDPGLAFAMGGVVVGYAARRAVVRFNRDVRAIL